jgi:hypothetical protein
MAGLFPSSELISVIQEILQVTPSHSSSTPQPSSSSSGSLQLSSFSFEELNSLRIDLENSYVTPLSLKLIQRYLKSDYKKRTLKSIIQGSSLKFPKFVHPTVEVCLILAFLTKNPNLNRTHWRKRKEESIYKEDNRQEIIIS